MSMFLRVATVVVLLFAAGGLGQAGRAQGATPAAGSTAYPLSIENCGRTLTIDGPPQRVIAGYQPVLESLLAIGVDDEIVGRMHWDENGPDGFLPGQKEIYDRLPEISQDILFPSKEVMLSLSPDFVISEGYYNFEAGSGNATVEELNAAGANVYIAGGWCSAEDQLTYTIDDTYQDLLNLGMIFDQQEKANTLVADLRAQVADVQERVAGLPKTKVLAFCCGEGPYGVYGSAGLMNQLIEIAGGENVLANVDDDYFQINVEEIAASNPDIYVVIDFLPIPGSDKIAFLESVTPESPAAKEDRAILLPAVASHPGYRNPLAIIDLAKAFHPEAFPE
jgi:iron complex transport system substrate-binding protein